MQVQMLHWVMLFAPRMALAQGGLGAARSFPFTVYC